MGSFKNGVKEGEGTFVFKNGGTYAGNWANNKYHNYGRLDYANGDIYSGFFTDGVYDGSGIFLSRKNGYEYEGGFQDGKFHGRGQKRGLFGIPYEDGRYENGRFIKQPVATESINTNYEIIKIGDWKSADLFGIDDRKERTILYKMQGENYNRGISIYRLKNGKYTSGSLGNSTDDDGLFSKHEYNSESECIEKVFEKSFRFQ